MLDIFNLFVNTFWQFFTFLDSIILIGSLSVLRLIIIVFLFEIGFKFLLPKNNNKE